MYYIFDFVVTLPGCPTITSTICRLYYFTDVIFVVGLKYEGCVDCVTKSAAWHSGPIVMACVEKRRNGGCVNLVTSYVLVMAKSMNSSLDGQF
jgi:hypothetical protein